MIPAARKLGTLNKAFLDTLCPPRFWEIEDSGCPFEILSKKVSYSRYWQWKKLLALRYATPGPPGFSTGSPDNAVEESTRVIWHGIILQAAGHSDGWEMALQRTVAVVLQHWALQEYTKTKRPRHHHSKIAKNQPCLVHQLRFFLVASMQKTFFAGAIADIIQRLLVCGGQGGWYEGFWEIASAVAATTMKRLHWQQEYLSVSTFYPEPANFLGWKHYITGSEEILLDKSVYSVRICYLDGAVFKRSRLDETHLEVEFVLSEGTLEIEIGHDGVFLCATCEVNETIGVLKLSALCFHSTACIWEYRHRFVFQLGE